MKCCSYWLLLLKHIAVGFILLLPVSGYSEAADETQRTDITSGSITIRSNSFEIDNKEGKIVFTGDVDAKSDDFSLNCQKALLYYHNGTEKNDSKKIGPNLDRIIATGEIKISQPDEGLLCMAENAVYYKEDEKIILTGKPVIKQGDNSIEGSIITLFLAEDRFTVEGTKDGRATITGFPGQDER